MSRLARLLVPIERKDPPGQQIYNTPGTYTFTVPAGYYQIRVVASAGGGGGGGAGALSSANAHNGQDGGDTSLF